MTITGGSALAEGRHRADDGATPRSTPRRTAQRREEAEARNQAETLAYQTEKFLGENADKVPDDIKTEVESAIADLKKTLEGTDIDAIRVAPRQAAQVSQKMGSAIYAQAQAANAAGRRRGHRERRRPGRTRTRKSSTPRSSMRASLPMRRAAPPDELIRGPQAGPVIRDRRRIDPDTGQVRKPGQPGDPGHQGAPGGPPGRGRHAAGRPSLPPGGSR